LLIVLSNFADHTDGELARISDKTTMIGHFYDLGSDALITVLLFLCLGLGLAAQGRHMAVHPALLGGIADGRRRGIIEPRNGKVEQAFANAVHQLDTGKSAAIEDGTK
jgi:hypothetical protein